MATMDHGHHHHGHASDTATDPVCGMKVTIATAKNKAAHAGHTYYFCSQRCGAKFTAEPDRYLSPKPAGGLQKGTMFTCPMHPEIRQEGPGACPICGMALEPLEATLDQGPNEELLDMKRRLWAAVALSVPIVILDMGGHFLRLDHLLPHGWLNWILLVLATPVVLVGRLAVLRARLAVARDAQPQHVHPDRPRHRHGVGLQRRRHRGASSVPRFVPAGRRHSGLFRAGGRDHLPGAGRPGARTARPRFDQRRHQGAAGPRAA